MLMKIVLVQLDAGQDWRYQDLSSWGGFKYEVQHGLTRRETPRGVS